MEGADSRLVDDPELLIAAEVVPDIAIVNLGTTRRGVTGLADEEGDGDGVATAGLEGVVSLLTALLATGPSVAAEVQDVDVVELVGEGVTKPVERVVV